MPGHLFCSETDGNLYDTRVPNWSRDKPLRAGFVGTYRAIETAAQLKATLRAGRNVFPGGYPLYFVASDGESLSFEAVRENLRSVLDSIATKSRDGWRVVGCDVNWEDSDMVCSHTGKPIESAYGAD